MCIGQLSFANFFFTAIAYKKTKFQKGKVLQIAVNPQLKFAFKALVVENC